MSSRTVSKLQDAIERCRTQIDEPLVVYILVQVRKLIESSGQPGKFDNLKFHCDWVLHSKLEWKGARNYLTNIDKLIGEFVPEGIKASTQAAVESLARFDHFIQELEELLRVHALPTNITSDPETRLKFLNAYVATIEGAALELTSDRLEHVKSLCVMSIPEVELHAEKVSLPVTFFIIAPDNKPLHRWSFTFAIDTTK